MHTAISMIDKEARQPSNQRIESTAPIFHSRCRPSKAAAVPFHPAPPSIGCLLVRLTPPFSHPHSHQHHQHLRHSTNENKDNANSNKDNETSNHPPTRPRWCCGTNTYPKPAAPPFAHWPIPIWTDCPCLDIIACHVKVI